MPFERWATADGPFTTPAGKIVVKMMHERDKSHRYARVAAAQLLELDYRGDLSMVIVLPDKADGLPAIEDRLAASYRAWLKALDYKVIDLALPRWTVKSRLELSDILMAMGMTTAFSTAADFTGTATGGPLFVDKVLQEAFIAVDEEGTEAAAVTVVVERALSLSRPALAPIPFHADHPFLYLIGDKKTGTVLFIGRVVDPR